MTSPTTHLVVRDPTLTISGTLTALLDMGGLTRTFAVNDSSRIVGSAAELTVSVKVGGTAGLTKTGLGSCC